LSNAFPPSGRIYGGRSRFMPAGIRWCLAGPGGVVGCSRTSNGIARCGEVLWAGETAGRPGSVLGALASVRSDCVGVHSRPVRGTRALVVGRGPRAPVFGCRGVVGKRLSIGGFGSLRASSWSGSDFAPDHVTRSTVENVRVRWRSFWPIPVLGSAFSHPGPLNVSFDL